MAEQGMSTAERGEFIARIDRALPSGMVEELTAAAAQRYGDRQPGFLDRMSAAGPGERLQVIAHAVVENAAQQAANQGMQYVPDEVGRSAEAEFTSLEMARALQPAADLGADGRTAEARLFADRALSAGGVATVGIQMHDLRGGLDSSGRLPGPQYEEPDNPAPAWLQTQIEGLAQEYGEVLADHRDRHSGLLEARRLSGIDAVRPPSGALAAKSGDGPRTASRAGETRTTGPQLG